ncbi:DUF4878 domain-containing protein [Peribacillus asahii]|uniref:DUF4878 domain-containing protein n=1 Tax=Peribacillus asahii TaxID=228899 RepID=UPI002079870F|nr:DUF4878 domain-containing protein [Peribacillus asahii]USK72629.1 DUF4878 domain-containing protein [Peribacillus asahii]USK72745.1 DUF4878 domain-containing protein [Peribacillus asahii]
MKKKIIITALGLLIALSAVATVVYTSPKELTPAETVTAFYDEAKALDVEGSKEYVSTDILKAFENGGFWHYGSYGGFISNYEQNVKTVKPIINTQSIKGNSASIDVIITYTNDRKEKQKYLLVKENSQWKIAK